MTRIKKGGRELVVADVDVQGYLAEGYVVIDEKGNPLSKPKALTYIQAMQDNVELKTKNKLLIAALEAANTEIERLKQQILDAETPKKVGDTRKASQDAPTTPTDNRDDVKQEQPSQPSTTNQAPSKANSSPQKTVKKA